MRRTTITARAEHHSWWPVIVNCVLLAITIRRMIRLSVDPSPGAANRTTRRSREI